MIPEDAPRFTPESRQALARAASLAQQSGYRYILSDHMFLALLSSPDCNAYAVLQALGVDSASLSARIKNALGQGDGFPTERPEMSAGLRDAVALGLAVAQELGSSRMGTEHLLVGLLKQESGVSPGLARALGIDAEKIQAQIPAVPILVSDSDMPWGTMNAVASAPVAAPSRAATFPDRPFEFPIRLDIPFKLSPVFIGFVAAMVIGASASYLDQIPPPLASVGFFVFVFSGWIISISLHEFGHAVVAFLGGDESVERRGYLSLNPFKYTNPLLSILMPLFIMLIGGIGLPGAAVYINPSAIRTRWMRSLTSAAGPIASLLCAFFFLIPFQLGLDPIDRTVHERFWSGLSLLVFLQITGVVFNLIPGPGLDGMGVIVHWLPEALQETVQRLGPWGLIFIFILFLGNPMVSSVFWQQMWNLAISLGLDPYLISAGFHHLQFWSQ